MAPDAVRIQPRDHMEATVRRVSSIYNKRSAPEIRRRTRCTSDVAPTDHTAISPTTMSTIPNTS
jgi:hypothetical protein